MRQVSLLCHALLVGTGWLCTGLALSAAAAPTVFDLGTARLTLDERGCVTSLHAADGTEYGAPNGPPAFAVETDNGTVDPTAVTRAGEALVVEFGTTGRVRFSVTEGRGFAILKVAECALPAAAQRLQLFCLPVKPLKTRAGAINACYDERFAAAVMGTEINVRSRSDSPGGGPTDLAGCSHSFVRVTDPVHDGKAAARFTATSTRTDNNGWSIASGRPFPKPLDLTGLKAVRFCVCGDNSNAALKIQLRDATGGARDDYIPVDFTGWKQFTCEKASYDTLHYDRVTHVVYYYNSMPANKTASCVIDQVEAVVGEGEQAKVVRLEDFEDPAAAPAAAFQGVRLYAETIRQFGFEPAGVGVLACPRPEFEATIERFEQASGLPSPHPDGVWSKLSPRTKRSYMLVFSLTDADVDDVSAFAKRGGFDSILIFQVGDKWCATTGHYLINETAYPRGLDSLRDVVVRFQQAGLKVGLHHLGASVYPPDPYVAPVPDPRLVRDAFTELAADVDAAATFIPTPAVPKGFPEKDVDYLGSGAVLQIGDELVHYSGVSLAPPFGFRGCARAFHGTRAAAHTKGDRVAHMHRSYGYYLYDMDSTIMGEIADRVAEIVNTCGLDMVYWDGSEQLQGEHWYYNAKLHQAFYRRFRNQDILAQASSYSPYSWHIISRYASADGHGDLKGYLDERAPSFQWYADNLMPLDLGWYSIWDGRVVNGLDEYEYILGKSLAYDASISFGASPEAIRRHPFIGELADLIRAYEQARLAGTVPEATRTRLREPKLDFHLLRDPAGPYLQRVLYQPRHDIGALDGKENVWTVEIADGPGGIGVELAAAPAGGWVRPGPSYTAAKALVLDDFASLEPYLKAPEDRMNRYVIGQGKNGLTSDGVTQQFEPFAEPPPGCRQAVRYTAVSALEKDGGWSAFGRALTPTVDLSWHRGIGFWLRGDGNGGQFKLQLRDDKDAATDYYIPNNYIGWRYHQLPRPDKDPIDYRQVVALIFYYNSLPGKRTVVCGIAGVKALPALDAPRLENPVLEVSGQRLAWPVTLAGGQTLIWWPGAPTRLRRAGSAPDAELPSPAAVTLPAGKHTFTFTCQEPLVATASVRLLLLPPERLALSGR